MISVMAEAQKHHGPSTLGYRHGDDGFTEPNWEGSEKRGVL